jgi:hypothetical protein
MFSQETEAAYQAYAAARIDTCDGVSFYDVIAKAQAALTLSKKYRAAGLSNACADKAAIEVIEAWNERYTADGRHGVRAGAVRDRRNPGVAAVRGR